MKANNVYFFILFMILFASCKKAGDTPGNPAPQPPGVVNEIPLPTPTNTSIYGTVRLQDKPGTYATGNMYINAITNSFYTGFFKTGTSFFDKYLTKMRIGSADNGYLDDYKTIATTSSVYNYVYAHTPKKVSAGIVSNATGGTFTIPNANGSSISFGINTLYQTPQPPIYPGIFSATMQGEIITSYLDPMSNDFAVNQSCYAIGDKNQKRWFLRSFGAIKLQMRRADNPYTGDKMDFYNGSTATLSLPIPSALLASAPDSVEKWVFIDGIWQNKGYAKKINNAYVGAIDGIATWNFAMPVKGKYRTIKLRTDSGATIINASVRIKNATGILAEVQTDADGNAFCFLPDNEDLTVEIFNRWNETANQNIINTSIIAAADTSSQVNITLNASNKQIYSFKGNAYNCDGTLIENGLVAFKCHNYSYSLYAPVTNGMYNTAVIFDRSGGNAVYLLNAKNNSSNVQGADTALLLGGGKINVTNLQICPPQTNLYMHYTVDGTNSYSIIGDFANHHNPALYTNFTAPATSIVAENIITGIGLNFAVNATTVGVYAGSSGASLFVNGSPYLFDYTRPSRYVFTRYDLLPNGYIIGTADIHYKDFSGVQHHVTASFKLKRVS